MITYARAERISVVEFKWNPTNLDVSKIVVNKKYISGVTRSEHVQNVVRSGYRHIPHKKVIDGCSRLQFSLKVKGKTFIKYRKE